MFEKSIDNLISEAKTIISAGIEQRRNAGGDYNIFSVLGIERQEVFTHSNIIYSFLNANSGHFMEKKYLVLFLEHVLGINDPIELKNEWYVEREWPFSDGRIDFVVYNDNRYIAIEMKIDAYDQEAQLSRYEKYAKSVNPHNYDVFYLTIDGTDASAQSASGLEKNYHRISFKQHINEWLKHCIDVTPIGNKTYNALMQYKELVQKLFSDPNRKVVEEMSKILQNAENYRAYLELRNSEHMTKQTFLEKFFHAFKEKLKQVDPEFINIVDDKIILETNMFLNNSSNRVGFSLDMRKQLTMSSGKQYRLLFTIDIGDSDGSIALGFTLAEIQGALDLKENVDIKALLTTNEDKEMLIKVIDYENKNAAGIHENSWIYWDYIYSGKKVPYKLRSFNEPVIDMLDDDKFDHEMDRIIGTVKSHLGRAKCTF